VIWKIKKLSFASGVKKEVFDKPNSLNLNFGNGKNLVPNLGTHKIQNLKRVSKKQTWSSQKNCWPFPKTKFLGKAQDEVW